MNTTNPKREVEREKLGAGEARIGLRGIGQPELRVELGDEGRWWVWLNTGTLDNDGLIVASDTDRVKAIGEAVGVLELLAEQLHTYLVHGTT